VVFNKAKLTKNIKKRIGYVLQMSHYLSEYKITLAAVCFMQDCSQESCEQSCESGVCTRRPMLPWNRSPKKSTQEDSDC
jgi:hypothetical protein